MSKKKAAEILALDGVDRSIYWTKRQLTKHWKTLTHEQWDEFCQKMADWFSSEAPDEWDKHTLSNQLRKKKAEKQAVLKAIKEGKKKPHWTPEYVEKLYGD